MAYKTMTEIYQKFGKGARWWNDMMPDPRFKLGEIYSVRMEREGNRIYTGQGNRIYTGQVVYSVRDDHVKLEHEDGNQHLYIYPKDEIEILDKKGVVMFGVGDRVRWIHNEPGAEYNELHGKVIELSNEEEYSDRVLVLYDDGMEEWEDVHDLTKE